MKILFIANPNSIHTQKWVSYFRNKYEVHIADCRSYHEMMARKEVFKPDIIHIHYAGWGALWTVMTGFKPIVLTAWGSDVLINQQNFFKRLVLKYILGAADLITCDAQHMIDSLIKLGVDDNKIERINFGIDTKLFNINPVPHIKPAVISLRSLELVYDLATLIRAVPLVLKQIPNALFVIVGDGSQKDMLKKLVSYYKIERNIIFFGQLPNYELPKLLNSCDCYVSTSLSDAGIAASTAEAMACGLPCLVTDVVENDKWIGIGHLFKPGHDAQLALSIVAVLQNKEQSRAIGLLNREMIDKYNNYEVEMGKMADLYEAVQ